MDLSSLLRPRSVALVGASNTADSVGEIMVRHAALGGLHGRSIWAVNPRYDEIHGVECFGSLAELPGVPDHVVIALGDARVDEALEDAIRIGVRAATIYGPLALDRGAQRQRVRERAQRAGVALLGGNAMGCYSFHHGFWNCGFATRATHRPGGTVLITQSGSVFYSLVDADERLDFHTVVGPGQELIVNAVDTLHDAIDQPGVTSQRMGLVNLGGRYRQTRSCARLRYANASGPSSHPRSTS
jgi:acyl-CoA synthetase (NDP forming)